MSMIPYGNVFDDPFFHYGNISPWGGWNNVILSPVAPLENLVALHPSVLPLTLPVSADIIETASDFVVHVDLPGVQGLEVSADQGLLTISGFREVPHDSSVIRLVEERSYGKVQRTLPLPFELDMDRAKATYKDGVLTLTFPKKTSSQVKRITF